MIPRNFKHYMFICIECTKPKGVQKVEKESMNARTQKKIMTRFLKKNPAIFEFPRNNRCSESCLNFLKHS